MTTQINELKEVQRMMSKKHFINPQHINTTREEGMRTLREFSINDKNQ